MSNFKLKELRKRAGIRQEDLAKRVGVSQALISQLESGCRNVGQDTIEAIADELKCPVKYLTGEPSIFVQFMRNCKQLSIPQLQAVNEIVSQILKLSASTTIKNKRSAQKKENLK